MKSDPIKDKSNPVSLVSICPQVLAERIRAIPEDILEMPLKDLEKAICVTEDDEMLRVCFAQEVERARRQGKPVIQANIYEGVFTAKTFSFYIANSFKLAYIIRPFPEYETSLENILLLGLQRMKNIMKQPLVDQEGKFDYRLAQIQISLFKDVSDRTRGASTQKVEMNSKSLSVSVTKDITHSSPIQIPDDLDRQLLELEAQTSNEVRTLSYEEKEVKEADIISEEDVSDN